MGANQQRWLALHRGACLAAISKTSRRANHPRTPSLKALMLSERLSFTIDVRLLRDELLNETLFRSLPHARAILDAWRIDYNTRRPHSSLSWKTPMAYASQHPQRAFPPRHLENSAAKPFASTAHLSNMNR
jgi:transposase InsO family protein